MFVFLISFLLFFPYERINFPGWGRRFRPLCLAPSSFLFLSFLGVGAHGPHGNGSRYFPSIYIYIWSGVGDSGFNCWGGEVTRARIILVLRECIWNSFAISLVIPAFGDTDSLCFPPRRVVFPLGFTLGDCLLFPYGE